MTSSHHVVLIGDPGPALPALTELGADVRLSWLALVPDLARYGQGPFRTAHALHRDADPEDWVTMARVLADQHEVSGVWHVGRQLGDVAQEVAADLGAPLVGGLPRPADRGPAEPDEPELCAKVLRQDGRTQLLLTTRVQRHASGVVLTEDGPHEVDGAQVLAWCADHVPAWFLGSVDLVATPSGLRLTGVRPWQPTDGTTELLRARGVDATELAWSLLTGATVAVQRTEDPGPDDGRAAGAAVAAYGSEVAGTLVALDGLEDARSVPGVLDVRALADPGAELLPLPEGGDVLVRVAATGSTAAGALRTAIDALSRTAPTVDVVPSLAGALDQVWF